MICLSGRRELGFSPYHRLARFWSVISLLNQNGVGRRPSQSRVRLARLTVLTSDARSLREPRGIGDLHPS